MNPQDVSRATLKTARSAANRIYCAFSTTLQRRNSSSQPTWSKHLDSLKDSEAAAFDTPKSLPLPCTHQPPFPSHPKSPPRSRRIPPRPESAASHSRLTVPHLPHFSAPPATVPRPASPAALALALPASAPALDRSAESELASPLPLRSGSLRLRLHLPGPRPADI